MEEFLKKLIPLALELDKSSGFNAVVVVNDIKMLYENHINEVTVNFERKLANCEKELAVTEDLLKERQRVLDAIPDCEIHGSCVPHAIEWIEEMKKAQAKKKKIKG